MTQPKIEDVGHGKPVMPFGSDGTDWYALLIDVLGHLQVDVVSAALGSGAATEITLLLIKGYVDALETLLAGGLPAALDSGALKIKEQSPLTGFATSTNQATMITALQLIDDLRAALGSVNTDDLQVDIKTYPGSNTLGNFPFGYYDRYAENMDFVMADVTEYKWSSAVPAGEIRVLNSTSIVAITGAATDLTMYLCIGAVDYVELAFAQQQQQYIPLYWNGSAILKEGDKILFVASGGAIGESIQARLWGYKMKIA